LNVLKNGCPKKVDNVPGRTSKADVQVEIYIKDYVLHQDQGGVTGVWDTTRLGVFNDM